MSSNFEFTLKSKEKFNFSAIDTCYMLAEEYTMFWGKSNMCFNSKIRSSNSHTTPYLVIYLHNYIST